MLPDLGKYAFPVLSAYAAMFILTIGVILTTLKRAKTSKETLAKLEQKQKAKADE